MQYTLAIEFQKVQRSICPMRWTHAVVARASLSGRNWRRNIESRVNDWVTVRA
jgi:hypothetical protein